MPASASVSRKGSTLEALDQDAAAIQVVDIPAVIIKLLQVETREDLLKVANDHAPNMTEHLKCLQDNWFSGSQSYWPRLGNLASVFAEGLAKALARTIKGNPPQPRLLDSHWLIFGDTFGVVSGLDTSTQKVTMDIITPKPTT